MNRYVRTLRGLIIAAAAVLGILPFIGDAAQAASLGIEIVVQVDSGSGFVTQGTAPGGATGSSTALPILVSSGDTVRFIIRLDQVATIANLQTGISADDPAEIDYVNFSAVSLAGKPFGAIAGNPNFSLNDGTPASGVVSIVGGTTLTVTTQDLYRLDYLVTTPVDDYFYSGFPYPTFHWARDFTVTLSNLDTGNTINAGVKEASVSIRMWAPEPSSILLLGAGIATLGLAMRRKGRG